MNQRNAHFLNLYFNFLILFMSPTCFEPEGSSSGRLFCVQLYTTSIEHILQSAKLLILMHVKRTVPYHNCIYSRLPEDEPSGSKYVEDIKKLKIKI